MKDRIGAVSLFFISVALYIATLAPTVVTVFDDSLELQLALPSFAIVHPTGYPLYTLLGWITSKLIPIGDAAFRVNLFSALAAAAAVALLYLVARRLGSAAVPAFIAALVFAIGPVWWSQATIAEVYALQGLLTLLILYALLRWDEVGASAKGRDTWLMVVGFAFGLGLAHHRLSLLLAPAAILFIFWGDPGLLRQPRRWIKPLVALLTPLLLYAILPLRAGVGSLDGTYASIGFWGWILGGGYSAFLRDNPFGIDRGLPDLLNILGAQFGLLGLALPFAGFGHWRMQPRRFLLLALIAVADLIFANGYLVADIEVFLTPLFIIWALFVAAGLTTLWDAANFYLTGAFVRAGGRPPQHLLALLLALPLLLWPTFLLFQHLPEQDRSHPPARAWGVHDAGLDMLHSAAPDAVLVGILGEMTLLRYFQQTEGLRPDLETIAADGDGERLAAIAASVEAARPTYTTRPVAGLAESYSLSAEGPLIRVWPPGGMPGHLPAERLANPVEQALTPEVTLIAWDADLRQPQSGPALRLNLGWLVGATPPADFKISARILAPDGSTLAQTDDFPVHNTYRPSQWRPGETILDSYDLALAALPDTPVTLHLILYNPADGSEIARWQQPDIHLH